MDNNKIQSKVLAISNVTESTYILRLERNGFDFKAGQYLVLSIPGERKAREYSIYSGENDDYIELLIKEVNPGELSHELKHLKIGTKVQISGPFGFFILKDEDIQQKKPVVFVATGTGISPFRSIIRSNPEIDYTVLHGVRYKIEAYHKEDYLPKRFVLCTSGENHADFNGRVTDYLKLNPINLKALYYLCGNSAMVDEAIEILEEQGLPAENIKTEIFF
ncbi:MAG: oxidoreductase [Prolixibacteraceae bacterium]|nr:oxidoreductase [Prolixibacteraceae bacterium]MBN2648547.1 oxidoreductase [Prolixibacteraceae bacterium]